MDRYVAKANGKDGQMLAPLPDSARFSTDKRDVGRFARWMNPDYNDSNWQTIKTDLGWQSLGLKDEDGLPMMTKDGRPYRGFGWYRFTVDVPAVGSGKTAKILCPAMNSQGWVWVNGLYAGRNDYMQAWFRPSELEIDVTKYLKPGKNVIAIRVDSKEEYFGANGIYENAFLWASR
jgi:beta-galactosidase